MQTNKLIQALEHAVTESSLEWPPEIVEWVFRETGIRPEPDDLTRGKITDFQHAMYMLYSKATGIAFDHIERNWTTRELVDHMRVMATATPAQTQDKRQPFNEAAKQFFEDYYKVFNEVIGADQRDYINALCEVNYWNHDNKRFEATPAAREIYRGLINGRLGAHFSLADLQRYCVTYGVPLRGDWQARVEIISPANTGTTATARKQRTWAQRLGLKSAAKWGDITLTMSDNGLYVSHVRNGGFIETWAALGLEGNTRERKLLQWFQEAGNPTPTLELNRRYDRRVVSLLRIKLKAISGFDGDPLIFKGDNVTRIFMVMARGGTLPEPEPEPEPDDDAVDWQELQQFDSASLSPEGGFHITQ